MGFSYQTSRGGRVLNYKKLLVISIIVNILFVIVFSVFLVKYHQAKSALQQNEQNLYREYIGNEESIKTSLKLGIKNRKDINLDELTQALNLNYTNIRLADGLAIPWGIKDYRGALNFSVPSDLNQFHLSLNVYLFQLLKSVRGGTLKDSDLEDIKTIINIIDTYEKTLNFGYYDSPALIKKKLDQADNKVIAPFLKSDKNPF